jgi:hypothetical protein
MNYRSMLRWHGLPFLAFGMLQAAETALPISIADRIVPTSATAYGMSGSPGFASEAGSMVFLSDAHNIERPAKRRPFLDLYQTDLVSGLSQRVFPRRVESDDALDGEIEAFSTSRSTRRVAAVTHAANLIPQDTNEVSDVVLRDLSSDTVFCLSCGPDGAVGSDSSGNPILSSDGRWVLFESQATNLTQLADTNRVRDVFLRDIESGTTTVVSSTGDRGLFNSPSRAMAISPDANLVVFRSDSTNPPAPAGVSSDLWLRWRSRGVVQRVGFDAQGPQVVRTVLGLALSENGRGLVCRVSGATNAIWSIDVDTGAPTLISGNLLSGRTKALTPSVSIDLIPPDARAVSITADGKRIAFLGIPKGTEEVRAYLWSAIGGLRDAMAPGDPVQLQGLELSPDGEALAFLTAEAVPKAGAPVGGVARWYVRNLTSGQTRPLGLASSGTLSQEAPVFHPRGDSVVFQSAGRFPEVPDDNRTDDVFRASFDTDQLELVSRRGPELPLVSGSGPSTLAPGALSHDGRFVAFVSLADNLVPGDSNGRRDVFVRDLQLGTNALVSVGLDGRAPSGDSWEARLSAHGRHVVFVSTATNLVAGDTNPVSAIYVRDLATGTTLLASARDQGDQKGESSAFNHQISANGEWVTFESRATNLVSGVTNSAHRLYLRHVPSQRTVLVSGGLSPSSRVENSGSFGAVMDGVGSRVVFLSRDDAYLYSVSAGTSQMLTTGIRAATLSLSQDGSRLALLGNLTNSPSLRAVYWRDLSTTTNRLIAAAPSTTQNRFANVSLSGDGRRVVFESDFVAPASTDTNAMSDVFAFDITSGELSMVSKAAGSDRAGNASSDSPVLSTDGEWVAFRSAANDLVAGDTNRARDIFVRNLTTGSMSLVSRRSVDGGLANGASSRPQLSGSGGVVAFHSSATDLMSGDYNQTTDLFFARLGVEAGWIIPFNPPSVLTSKDSPLPLPPASERGRKLAYTVLSGPASIAGDRLELLGAGRVEVRVDELLDNGTVSLSVTRRIEVPRLNQSIAWDSPAADQLLLLNRPVPLLARASSGLPVSFRVQSGSAVISNGAVIVTNLGPIVLVAEQAGDAFNFRQAATRIHNRTKFVGSELVSEWPGYARGDVYDLQVVGNLAYLALGRAGMMIVDVSSPAAPRPLGRVDTVDEAHALSVAGNLAYVADRSGLQVIDVSDPAAPRRVGGLYTYGAALGVHVVGTLAYVANGYAGLQVVDVSKPATPVLRGAYDTSGHAFGVQVVGKLAYVADDSAGLQILDVSNPAAPRRLGGFDTSGNARGVKVVGDRAHVADFNDGLQVIDVGDPATPRRLGGFKTSGAAIGVQVVGSRAYVARSNSGFEVIDVSDPANMLRLGEVSVGGPGSSTQNAGKIQVEGQVAYLASWSAGLQMVDVSQPNAPVRLGGLATGASANDVQVVGNRAYLADGGAGLQVIDVTDPSALRRLGGLEMIDEANGLTVEGHLAYVAAGDAGLQVIDVGVAESPRRMGGLDTRGSARSVQVLGNHAYLADGYAGLQTVDVSNPSSLKVLGNFDTGGWTYGISMVDGVAYLADGYGGLKLVDVNNAKTPTWVGGLEFTAGVWLRDVQVVEDRAYVAGSGLDIIDISNRSAPVRLGGLQIQGIPVGVRVIGNLAYIAAEGGGVQVIDVSNPSAPVLLGILDTRGTANQVTVNDGLAYVADGEWGLQVWRMRLGVEQSISLDLPTLVTRASSPLSLVATSSSGLPVVFKVASGPAEVSGSQLNLTGSGTVVLRAEQSGDSQILPVTVERTIRVQASEPVVTQGPVGQSVVEGKSSNFSVTATGEGPLRYQWSLNGVALVQATNATLRLPATALSDAGTYTVEVSNAFGRVISAPAVLRVLRSQTIAWTSPAAGQLLRLNQPVPLVAQASSGLPVVFRVQSGSAVISDGMVTVTNLGSVVLVAEQAGDTTNATQTLTQTFNPTTFLGADPLGEWPEIVRGEAQSVQVVGDLAYLAIGAGGLVIFDISNPAAPVRLGGLDTSGFATGVQVVGNLAYVADNDAGLQILDVSNPAAPVRRGGFDTSGSAQGVQVVGNLAYVADGGSGLQILDVSNPAAPVRRGGFDTSSYARGVQVVGNLAYVADSGSGLQILDVSNPAAPVRLGGYDTSGYAYGVQVVGSLAYIADDVAGLQILDVSTPAAPVRLGGYDTGGNAVGVQVVGSLAYVADGYSGLQILDVSKPAAPESRGGYDTSGNASSVQVVGNLAYVADGYNGLQILDVKNLAAPMPRGGYKVSGFANDVHRVGNLAYVADSGSGLQILDVSNPAAPVRLGGFDTSGWASGVQVVGNLAYVANGYSGLLILDVSNPAAPVRRGGFDTSGFAYGVRVAGNLAYIADYDAGLQILDVSNPAAPVRRGGFDTSGFARGVQVMGNLAFVADGGSGLQILDVSNPTAPVRLGGYDTGGWAVAVQVVGSLAYVADGAGLQILEVSNPVAPLLRGGYRTSGYAYGVQVLRNLAYVADGSAGLQVIDVSDPAAPVRLGGYETSGTASSVQVEGNLAYVADGEWGLQLLRLRLGVAQALAFDPPAPVTLAASPVRLVATANSGLSVSFTVVSGPATVVGDLLTLTGEGTVVVRAGQGGDEQFLPAPPVQREITVLATPTPLRLSEVSMVPEGRLRFRMEGPTGGRVVLRFSPDLRTWIAVSTNTVPMALELPAISEQTAGFYRITMH